MTKTPSNVTSITRRADIKRDGVATGEVAEWEERKRARYGRKSRRIKMTMVDTDVMTHLEMTATESRVLWGLIAHIPKGGGHTAYVQVSELAKELGMAQPNVSKVLKALRSRNIVKSVRTGQHQVNPWIAWKGEMVDWVAESEDWDEPTYVRADMTTGEVK